MDKQKAMSRLKSRAIADASGCLIWQGSTNRGYGLIRIDGVLWRAHRLSYELHNEVVPCGMYVLHRCDNPSCINPEHLFVGTQLQNIADAIAKKRYAFGSKRSRAKLTENIVRDARALRLRPRDLVRLYGVDSSTASTALSGRRWRHV